MIDDAVLRFLVPLDGTPAAAQALPYAQALAVSPAEIVLLQVVLEPQPERGLFGKIVVTADAILQRTTSDARAALEADADRLRDDTPSVGVEVAVAVGRPDQQILETARMRRTDLIVMASNSRSVVGRLVLGSVTDQVVQAANVPVLVIRPRDAVENLAPAQLRRLVVLLDGSDFADQALPVAERLAVHTGLPVHLQTVVDGHATRMKKHLDRRRAGLERRGLRVGSEVLVGSAVDAIERASLPGDLVVMASHHRSGVAAWVFRGVAERLIHGGRAPVLLAPNATTPATSNLS